MEMKTINLLLGPGVYAVWGVRNNSDEALYIGSAKNILHRISHPKHAQLRRALAEGTRIEFKYTETERDARGIEKRMIWDFQPKYNTACKGTNYEWLNR